MFCSGKGPASSGVRPTWVQLGPGLAFMALGKLLEFLMPHLRNRVNGSYFQGYEDDMK